MSTPRLNTGLSMTSLPPKDDPKILACSVLAESLTQFYNNINPGDLNQVSVEARQLVHLDLSINQ